MSFKIIMLSGKQGSGKTTIMQKIMERAQAEGFIVHNVIFASTIYLIHDYAMSVLASYGIKRDIVKDGKLLQLLGTEWGRATLGEDIWVRCLLGAIDLTEQIDEGSPSPRLYIISDCRFQNEFDGVNAFKVRLEASKEVRKERCSQWRENDAHPSEIDLDGYASNGKFDCYVDTELDRQGSVDQIINSFNHWAHDRDSYVKSYSGSKESFDEKYYEAKP